jgi:hypothetical protein
MSYQRLLAEHDAIEALAGSLESVLDGGAPDALAAVALLEDLASAIEEHHREEQVVYGRLCASGDPLATELVAAFVRQCDSQDAEWRAYIGDWGRDCIAADWETFRAETGAVIARLHQRLRAEASTIYPVALQRGVIRLRAA